MRVQSDKNRGFFSDSQSSCLIRFAKEECASRLHCMIDPRCWRCKLYVFPTHCGSAQQSDLECSPTEKSHRYLASDNIEMLVLCHISFIQRHSRYLQFTNLLSPRIHSTFQKLCICKSRFQVQNTDVSDHELISSAKALQISSTSSCEMKYRPVSVLFVMFVCVVSPPFKAPFSTTPPPGAGFL